MLLVTGGSGQLGTALKPLLGDARYPSRSELDLGDPSSLPATLDRFAPGGIINCAAFTGVDRAEEAEDEATVVNGTAVGVMAGWAAAAGVPFVTFSSDYVFDGAAGEPYVESSPTAPVNAYGRSKLAGEEAALASHPGSLVVRTSWVISGTHPNFVATMLRLAAARSLRVVDDQVGCPTVAADLASAVVEALREGVTGVLHLTNRGATTWYELARTAVGLAGMDPRLVTPCPTAEYPTPAARPACSALASDRMAALGLRPLPHWRASLPPVVAGLLERGG